MNTRIDEFAPGLIDRRTGKILPTEITSYVPKRRLRGWKFDFSESARNGYNVYALRLKDDNVIQGLISGRIEPENHAFHLDIVETAPHNYGHKGEYDGVGAHLFAFGCKLARDSGYDLIYFDAKTNLIKYYEREVSATSIGGQRMIITGTEFNRLVEKYYG